VSETSDRACIVSVCKSLATADEIVAAYAAVPQDERPALLTRLREIDRTFGAALDVLADKFEVWFPRWYYIHNAVLAPRLGYAKLDSFDGIETPPDRADAIARLLERLRLREEASRPRRPREVPQWDSDAFELRFKGWAKRYRRNASSQVHVLATFQAKKWKRSISSDDMCNQIGPNEFKSVAKHLNEAINKDGPAPIRFAPGGHGIRWDPVDPASE
jgi:hypothetical protein